MLQSYKIICRKKIHFAQIPSRISHFCVLNRSKEGFCLFIPSLRGRVKSKMAYHFVILTTASCQSGV